jgi:hypothetical protein
MDLWYKIPAILTFIFCILFLGLVSGNWIHGIEQDLIVKGEKKRAGLFNLIPILILISFGGMALKAMLPLLPWPNSLGVAAAAAVLVILIFYGLIRIQDNPKNKKS